MIKNENNAKSTIKYSKNSLFALFNSFFMLKRECFIYMGKGIKKMNKSLKMATLLTLMVSNSCFSMGFFKSVKDIDLKESFGETLKENIKITAGITLFTTGSLVLITYIKDRQENKRNNNDAANWIEDSKIVAPLGALSGLILACIVIKYVKTPFEQMLREMIAKKGKQFVLNLIKN